jgi:cyanate lyase
LKRRVGDSALAGCLHPRPEDDPACEAAGGPLLKTEKNAMMSKVEMTEAIVEAKFAKGCSWSEIATAVGLSEVFVTSVCLGQNSFTKEQALKLTEYLDFGNRKTEVAIALQQFPLKAQNLDPVAKDPLIYRFFEIAYVYGDTIKAIVHDKFGDGIMSAIDFDMSVDRIEDPKGDRVQVTMSGKFLPYKRW